MSDKDKKELTKAEIKNLDYTSDCIRNIADKLDAAHVIISIRTNKGDFGCIDMHSGTVNLSLTKLLLDKTYKYIEEKSQKESRRTVKIKRIE